MLVFCILYVWMDGCMSYISILLDADHTFHECWLLISYVFPSSETRVNALDFD